MTLDDLLREVSDPATAPGRLLTLWNVADGVPVESDQHRLIWVALLRNPSLPLDTLRRCLINGRQMAMLRHAWFNPSVPLLLLTGPDQALVASAIETIIWPTLYPYLHEPTEETVRTLGVHVRRRLADDVWHEEAKALARRFVDLFGLASE